MRNLLVFGLAVALAMGLIWIVDSSGRWAERCEKANGIPVTGGMYRVCIRQEAVIEVE